jgi:lysophospholipase L1-like esterase
MARTVLFFGDSNTRGYGVGRQRRYAALIEAALAPALGSTWSFAVSVADSDFRVISERLDAAVAKHRPRILVWQLPTGPAAYFVRYPTWLQAIRTVFNTFFEGKRARAMRADVARGGGETQRPLREALYEGRYIDGLYRWRPSAWPLMRYANGFLAARHGLVVKATRERYLELVDRRRDQLRQRPDLTILFLGLLPHNDCMYPGFGARVTAWDADLRALLHRPDEACFFLELYAPLMDGGADGCLLHDGTHMSLAGHRRVAELVGPPLLALIRSCDGSAA